MTSIDGNGDWSDCGYSGQKVMFVSFPDSFETWQPKEREKKQNKQTISSSTFANRIGLVSNVVLLSC